MSSLCVSAHMNWFLALKIVKWIWNAYFRLNCNEILDGFLWGAPASCRLSSIDRTMKWGETIFPMLSKPDDNFQYSVLFSVPIDVPVPVSVPTFNHIDYTVSFFGFMCPFFSFSLCLSLHNLQNCNFREKKHKKSSSFLYKNSSSTFRRK